MADLPPASFPAAPNADLLSDPRVRLLITEASEAGAKKALASIGLHDEDAAADVRDLRQLLDGWRETKRTMFKTIAQIVTTAVLTLIVAGLAVRLWRE